MPGKAMAGPFSVDINTCVICDTVAISRVSVPALDTAN